MTHLQSIRLWQLLAGALVLAACGGGSGSELTAEPQTQGSMGGHEADPENTMQIEGILGTMSQDEVQRGLEPRMDRFLRCFADRYDDLDVLGGEVQLAFHIAMNGRVSTVHAKSSTVGDRETERCLLEVASGARFPRPHGGDAEFEWPLAFDLPADVRPPLNWDAVQLSHVISEHIGPLREQCGSASNFHVTVYIAPGGQVLASGASSSDLSASAALDCVAEAVRSWPMPDPGSYPAKATFDLR